MPKPRQNQVLLNVLHKRWPKTGHKFLKHEIAFADRKDLLAGRKAYSDAGWFIKGCYLKGAEFVVSAMKPWPTKSLTYSTQ